MAINLAKHESVDIREVWKHEAKDITQWLAKPDNLRLLGETTGDSRRTNSIRKREEKMVKGSKNQEGDIVMTVVYPVGRGLYVNMTNRCPCACTFCIRQNGAGVYGSGSLWLEREPTVEETVAALERAGLSDCDEVVFCGYGEPTERLDDLLEVARRIRAVAPQVPIRVNTNGLADLIAGQPTAARFEGLVDVLSISLNAPTAEEYVQLCRPKFGLASYEAMLRFAAEARRHVPSVVLSVVGTPDMTEEKVAACRAVCDRVGVPLRVRTYSPPEE